jgi:hypothetical protein
MRRGVRILLPALMLVGMMWSLAGCGPNVNNVPTKNIDVAKDVAAKANLLPVKTAIQTYIATNGALPSSAAQSVIGGVVNPWPTNPFTKAPMAEGTAPGDYTYTPGSGTSYTLVVHLSDGTTAAAP